jgi:predicted nucleic acid-binding Zn ribbon protein
MKREPVAVGVIAAEWARRRGIESALSLGISDPDVWSDLVGADLAECGRPVRCEGGTLFLQAHDPLGATRLRYAEGAILAVCNEKLGREAIRRLSVREASRK